MPDNKIALMKSDFDSYSQKTDEGVEYWLAREKLKVCRFLRPVCMLFRFFARLSLCKIF